MWDLHEKDFYSAVIGKGQPPLWQLQHRQNIYNGRTCGKKRNTDYYFLLCFWSNSSYGDSR